MSKTPVVSIVVLVRDRPYLMKTTLDSIFSQKQQSYEVLVVENGLDSLEKEFILSYPIGKLVTSSMKSLPIMLNKGLSLAKGKYVQFIFAGQLFLSARSLSVVIPFLENESYDFVYSPYLRRDDVPTVIYRPFSLKELKKGNVPTRLEACWFNRETINSVQGFDYRYEYRYSYDLLCRLIKLKKFNVVSVDEVLTDYDYYYKSARILLRYSVETILILLKHFGITSTIVYCLIKDHLRFIKFWLKGVKKAFWNP